MVLLRASDGVAGLPLVQGDSRGGVILAGAVDDDQEEPVAFEERGGAPVEVLFC